MKPLVRQSGLTLLEVMVALFIFAVTGTAIMKAASEHLNGVGQIEEVAVATWVANNRLNEILMERPWPLKNNQKGQQDMAGRTWYWTQVVKATNDSDFKAVEISVSLKESRADNITTVVAYLAKPSEATQ
ncbi:general secretion pathway protein I [Marisediminitalea aggregata]|uniref:Type II secretion system protein I n=1 Tax=Marisediminitalea aggregata TaxID=634436 RepID=A0A1M5FAS8_9ALTE|nr:type II secretion system minor pseudopilin GspI [Marisediminitalea aggregata]MEC7825265.1 type II secretion system minor pseudopilin GspI [Pseudomonadota bacterium]SHF88655.1 general secretion pathway protein I [Marisediminitalea aggregata]